MNRDVGPVTAYADAVAGGYPGTRAQFRTLLANLPHGVFIAQYNSTSYDDIKDALDAGLFVVAKGPATGNYTEYYVLAHNETRLTSPYFLFTSVRSNGNLSYLMCHKTNGWSMSSVYPARTFVATYGDTTYEEVADALANEMVVFAENGDFLLPYVGDIGGGPLFSGVTYNTVRTWSLDMDHDTWSHYEFTVPDNASELSYSNATSSLDAITVQGAIDELAGMIGDVETLLEAL